MLALLFLGALALTLKLAASGWTHPMGCNITPYPEPSATFPFIPTFLVAIA
jgi:hypothetical protein